MPTLIHLWDCARLWLWIHPWWHAFILVGTPVLISTILTIWGLHHSSEANRLSKDNVRLLGEANVLRVDAVRIGEEQKNSVICIEQLQGERNKLQNELNELQAKRNESLDQIAVGVKREPTSAEKTAAKLCKYIGQPAYVTNHDGSSWGSMGAVIAEVSDDILTLFTPVSQSSSRAMANFVHCDKLQLVEIQMGGCPVQIKILERFGAPVDCGAAKTWAERSGAQSTARPRGGNVFSAIYRKEGIGPTRSIHVYDPTSGNPSYTLVTRDNNGQEETGVFYCDGVKELATKFNVIQLEWAIDKWGHNGGNGNKALFLFTH